MVLGQQKSCFVVPNDSSYARYWGHSYWRPIGERFKNHCRESF